MAWISVHQQVIGGAKLRSLAKRIGCSRHEALGILVVLWTWGLDNADEYGYLINADEDDISDAIEIGLSRNLNPKEVVDALIEVGWIDCTEHGMMFHDWTEWQAPWYKAREKRQRDSARQREIRQRGRVQKQPETTPSPSPSPPPAHPESVASGLGDELTEEDLRRGDELEQKTIPGIERICRSVGMSFTAYDDKTARDLLMTYEGDEIGTAISKAAEQGKANWAYIKGILRNGGGKRDGSGNAAGVPAQARARHGGDEDRPGRYGLESTKV